MDYFWFFVWLGFFPFFQLFFGRKADCGQCNQVDEWSGWLAVFAPRAGASCNTREYGLKGLRRSVCNPRNYPFIAGGVAAPLPRTDSAISCITQHFPLALLRRFLFGFFVCFSVDFQLHMVEEHPATSWHFTFSLLLCACCCWWFFLLGPRARFVPLGVYVTAPFHM